MFQVAVTHEQMTCELVATTSMPLVYFDRIMQLVANSREWSRLVGSVQDGIFQHAISVSPRDHRVLLCRVTSKIMNLVDEFMKLSELVKRTIPTPEFSFTVYRSMWNIPAAKRQFHHPIPFSTTLCADFAEDWLQDHRDCVVLHIPATAPGFIPVDKDVERELVFPPGTIEATRLLNIKNGVRHYLCTYTQECAGSHPGR